MITLGIVGVLAAMTLPGLINKYNEKVWVTSFLRVYSILEKVYQLALDENGPVENWSGIGIVNENDTNFNVAKYDDKYFIFNVFKPYLPIAEVYDKEGKKNCMPDKSYFLNGEAHNIALSTYTPTVLLQSGECIAFGAAYPSMHSFFWVDTNGKKLPNTLGKDQFLFKFALHRIAPFGWTDSAADCDISSTNANAGKSCGAWIVRYKNMNYLHLPFDKVEKYWGSSTFYWE